MKFFWFGMMSLFLFGLAACETPTHEHAVYRSPVICTDMKPFQPISKPVDEQTQPVCTASNPGSEMYDREKGQVGVVQGAGIIVTEVFYGLTGVQ